MQTYNIAAQIHHLKTCCSHIEWRAVTPESAVAAIEQLLAAPATETSWGALMELFAAWPDTDNIHQWVQFLEPRIHHWPWRMRSSILGQGQTRAEKSCVYRLIGKLIITDCEDLSGQKLKHWSKNPDWSNMKGIVLRKVETDANHLHDFLSSPYLKNICSIELSAVESLSGKLLQLFNNLQLSNVHELRLASLNLTPEDTADINKSTFASQLTLLDLSSNFITGKDLITLFGKGQFPSLQRLVINYCTIHSDHLTGIFEKLHHPTLEEICFAGTEAAKTLGIESLQKKP